MAKRMRFRQAIELAGGDKGRFLETVDYVLGGALVAGAVFTKGGSIQLFDGKNYVIDLLAKARERIRGRLNGSSARHRSDVLLACHTITVIASFFEAVEADPTFKGLELTRHDEERLAGLVRDNRRGSYDMVGGLLSVDVPVPSPSLTYETLSGQLREYYVDMAGRLGSFLRGLRFWDEIPENDRLRLGHQLSEKLPEAAMRNYRDHFIELSDHYKELLWWCDQGEHAATRQALTAHVSHEMARNLDETRRQLRESRTSLDGLTRLLRQLWPQIHEGLPLWQDLETIYRNDVARPQMESDELTDVSGVEIPQLTGSYVNPAFRLTEMLPEALVSEERWWRRQSVHDNIQEFLAGYLTCPTATEQPLVVLGHPGGGKSVLSRILAANLSKVEICPVRVDLRFAPPEGSILDQIEAGLHAALRRPVSWAEMTDKAGDRLPVVILDGFDELLQRSSASRSDYLKRVVEFQQGEKDRNQHVAVIVTSRTIVAHRAKIPMGSFVLRLEPFDGPRVEQWIRHWNDTNVQYFSSSGRQPLDVATVSAHPQLAEQPLLLLMLALYDAQDNALHNASQGEQGQLSRADLYERLLRSFVEREVKKRNGGDDQATRRKLIGVELDRLAVTAFAMYNRASQVIDEEGLIQDLRSLRSPAAQARDDDQRTVQLFVGRFFFVHMARASHRSRIDDPADFAGPLGGRSEERSYEFLHATFGEYLIARHAVGRARLLHQASIPAEDDFLAQPEDNVPDSLLHALLSFQPLTARGQIVSFVLQLVESLEPPSEAVLQPLYLLLRRCRRPRRPGDFDGYQPVAAEIPQRIAAYSVNLLVLLIALNGGPVPVAAFLGPTEDAAAEWRRLTRLWQSGFEDENWRSVLEEFVTGTDGRGRLVVDLRRRGDPGGPDADSEPVENDLSELYRSNDLIGDPVQDRVLSSIEPLVRNRSGLFAAGGDSDTRMGALLNLLFRSPEADVEDSYRRCIEALTGLHASQHAELMEQVLHKLKSEDLPASVVARLLRQVQGEAFLYESSGFVCGFIECATAWFGRDAATDAILAGAIIDVTRVFEARALFNSSQRRHLRMAVLLDELGLGTAIPLPWRLEAALSEADLAALGERDPRLLATAIHRAVERECAEVLQHLGWQRLFGIPDSALRRLTETDVEYLVGAARAVPPRPKPAEAARFRKRWRACRIEPDQPGGTDDRPRWWKGLGGIDRLD